MKALIGNLTSTLPSTELKEIHNVNKEAVMSILTDI